MLYIFTPNIIELSSYLSLLNRVKNANWQRCSIKDYHIKILLGVHFPLITTLTTSDIDYSYFSH